MKLFINGIEFDSNRIKETPTISRSIKNRGSEISFSVKGYPYSTAYIPYNVEVRKQNGDLRFIGNLKGYSISYEPDNQIFSVMQIKDKAFCLRMLPIFGNFRGSFSSILDLAILLGGATNIFSVTYKVGLVKAQRNIKMLMIGGATPVAGSFILVGNLRFIFVDSNASGNQILIDMPDSMALALNNLINNADSSLTNCTSEVSGNILTLTAVFPSAVFDLVSDSQAVTIVVVQDASLGGSSGEDITIEETRLNVKYMGAYLIDILEDITSLIGVNWYLDSKTGNIVIYQLGINENPPHTINTTNFFTCSNKNKSISYSKNSPELSSALVFGINGEIRQYPSNIIPQEMDKRTYLLSAIQDRSLAGTTYDYPELANKVVAVRITSNQAQPPIVENCRIGEITISGFNYIIPPFSPPANHQYFIPADLLAVSFPIPTTTQAAELIYSGSIVNVGNQALISIVGITNINKIDISSVYALNGNFFAIAEVNIQIKINGSVVFNKNINYQNIFTTINYKLTNYIGDANLNFEVKLSLPIQHATDIPGFTPGTYLDVDITNGSYTVGISCCNTLVVVGKRDYDQFVQGFSGDGNDSRFAQVNRPRACIKKNGNYYIADTFNYRIRKITSGFIISTIAGGGANPPTNNANPLDVAFGEISGVEYYNNEVYFTDSQNKLLCKINNSNQLEILFTSSDPDSFLTAIYIDPSNGNIFFSDSGIHVIYRLDTGSPTPIIIAGIAHTSGFTGDGGVATSASLNTPYGLTVYNDKLYFADVFNHRVRKIDLITGIITTIAGTGNIGFNGDWIDATTADLNYPTGVAVEDGDVVIVDSDNYRVRRVNFIDGIITTIAGNGLPLSFFYGRYADYISATATQILPSLPVNGYLGGQCFIDSDKELIVADSALSNIRHFFCRLDLPFNPRCPQDLITFMNPTGDFNFLSLRNTVAAPNLGFDFFQYIYFIQALISTIDTTPTVSTITTPVDSSGSETLTIDLRNMQYNGHVLTLVIDPRGFVFSRFATITPPGYTSPSTSIHLLITINGNIVFEGSASNPFGNSIISQGGELLSFFDLTNLIGTIVTVVISGEFHIGLDSTGVITIPFNGTYVGAFFSIICKAACDGFIIDPTSAFFTSDGGSDVINITTDLLCSYTASTISDWIQLNNISGVGNGSISYSISPNPNTVQRNGSIVFTLNTGNLRSFIITQAALIFDPCTLLRITNISTTTLNPDRDVLILIPSDNPYSVELAGKIFPTSGSDPLMRTIELTATINLTDSRLVSYVGDGGFLYINYTTFAQVIPAVGETMSALARLITPLGMFEAFAEIINSPDGQAVVSSNPNYLDISSLVGTSFGITFHINLIDDPARQGLRLDGGVSAEVSCIPKLPPGEEIL